MNSPLATLYIVRHGETEWNVKGLLQGHSDSPLTKRGLAQAKKLTSILKYIPFDEVFSSDLLRAKRTAEAIALERKLILKTTRALRERSFGKFEGKPYKEINNTIAKLLLEFEEVNQRVVSRLQVGDAETIEQSISRFITFLREIAIGFKGKTILIVTHGSMMREFLIHIGLATYKTLPQSGSIDNLGFIKLESDGVDFYVKETKGINIKEQTP